MYFVLLCYVLLYCPTEFQNFHLKCCNFLVRCAWPVKIIGTTTRIYYNYQSLTGFSNLKIRLLSGFFRSKFGQPCYAHFKNCLTIEYKGKGYLRKKKWKHNGAMSYFPPSPCCISLHHHVACCTYHHDYHFSYKITGDRMYFSQLNICISRSLCPALP
jgi:hypothetical protein